MEDWPNARNNISISALKLYS